LWSSTRSKLKFYFRVVPCCVAPQDIGHIALIGNIVLESGMAYVCEIDIVVILFSTGIAGIIVTVFSLNVLIAYSVVASKVENRGSTNNYSQKVKCYVFISCMFHHSLPC
jgi:pheromone shutdown protein TraB